MSGGEALFVSIPLAQQRGSNAPFAFPKIPETFIKGAKVVKLPSWFPQIAPCFVNFTKGSFKTPRFVLAKPTRIEEAKQGVFEEDTFFDSVIVQSRGAKLLDRIQTLTFLGRGS
eukprot:TRINITY_DN11309_c0_g1_i15.p3 TRINITY_DN11309_c0_g1~~TRINITY_DN11309_c0_g1_i15.p3  ORF type:complete len:114 (-),score=17.60 TRINITY_DN11309_c0_g1_i15:392-733(-)